MEQKRIVDVEATEELGELSQGVELKYRIVEVSQHKRKKQDDGTFKWVDEVYYQVEEIVPSGWFSRNGKLLCLKMNMVPFLNLKIFLIL